MHSEQIPVLLEFIDVTANSALSINITTPGVTWSLGCRFGDTLGLSYNVVPDDVADAQSCIQKLTFNDNLLSIRTSAEGAALNSFTLSLFLQRDLTIDSLMGYCSLNNEATVRVYFGNELPMIWRNGRISAVLQTPAVFFRQVLFTVKGARPGNRIGIRLSTRPDLGDVAWTLGPSFSETQGVRFTATGGGSIPVTALSYTRSKIKIVTATTRDDSDREVCILAYVSWMPESLQMIYLKSESSENVEVYAQVSNRQPQYLSPTFTLFTL